jgi:hypothetical protein
MAVKVPPPESFEVHRDQLIIEVMKADHMNRGRANEGYRALRSRTHRAGRELNQARQNSGTRENKAEAARKGSLPDCL